jgi:MFS family permease
VETPVTPEARKALWGSAVGYAMDGFDLLILGFMLRAIAGELHLDQPEAASLVTGTLVGAVLGGLLFGMLSDRLGRVRVLTWTIVLFAVFTGLCAFAQGYWDLLAYRTIAGLGLGGELGRPRSGPAPPPMSGSAGRRVCCWRRSPRRCCFR